MWFGLISIIHPKIKQLRDVIWIQLLLNFFCVVDLYRKQLLDSWPRPYRLSSKVEQIEGNIFDVSESRVSHMMRSFIRFLHRQIASIVWIFLKSLPDISQKSNHVDHIIPQLIHTTVMKFIDTKNENAPSFPLLGERL